MRNSILLVSLAALAPTLRADRFYLGTEAEDAKFKGQEGADARASISGVLVREQNGMLVIRVEGGEMWIERARVYRVEKDGLTVAQIEERERSSKEKLAAAAARRQGDAVEAAARRTDKPAAAEPRSFEPQSFEPQAKALTVEVDFAGLLPGYKFNPNSDVLRRVDLTGLSRQIEDWLRGNGVDPKPGAQRDFAVHVDFKGLLPSYAFSIYDPVIHRVDLRRLARQVEDYLRSEVNRAANRGKRWITQATPRMPGPLARGK